MSLVLYRKYRPKTFGELSSQDHIVQTLTNAIASDRLAHAYLFCGPRGTGKTTTARLLAKAINCESLSKDLAKKSSDKTIEPCNECEHCIAINNGNAMDIIEIDAASNRGINEIRDLRDGIQFSPALLKYKVFIIDEAHMLTKEAFNALLKTLEEPPAHAVFILATTESGKVPATILSRCQRFDFKKVPTNGIVERLKSLAKKEKIKCSDEVIDFIAQMGDGAFRDAESLLGQVASVSDGEITLEVAQDVLGVADMQDTRDFVDLLSQNNTAEIFRFVNNIYTKGKDIAEFTKSVSGYLRKMMICQIDNSLVMVVAKDMSKDQQSSLCSQAGKFENSKIHKLVSRFVEAESQMKRSSAPIIHLELAIIDILGL